MCGGWVGKQLANIDPGPAIGSGLADVDEFVGREIPGGWTTVGAAAALGTGLYFAPEIMAAYGGEVGAQQALSSFTPEMLAYANASADPIMAINAISGMTPAEFAAATSATGAGVGAPILDYSQEVILSPSGNYIPANTLPSEIAGLDAEILKAGEAALKATPSISPSQAVNTLRGASGLLGGAQQGTPAGAATQFRGNAMPQGAVDYSGILNLLQAKSPQRNPNSLLG
jgi:hypothetical protein